jgi:putative transposase
VGPWWGPGPPPGPRLPTEGLPSFPIPRSPPLLISQFEPTIAVMERYRIHPEAAVYFVTYSVVEWLAVFIREAACKIVTDSLVFCHRQKQLRINAFVIMPTHLHLIVFDGDFDPERLGRTLADFRKFTGRQLSDYSAQLPGCFAKTFREQATADRQRRLWQPSRHPEALLNEAFWQQKIDYIHKNPRRSGLVRAAENWRFSSAAWYLSEGREVVDVPLTALAW